MSFILVDELKLNGLPSHFTRTCVLGDVMKETELIYDWNTVEYELTRNPANHPHDIWFDDETLRDGLQSPSARNPTIEQKLELLDYMERN